MSLSEFPGGERNEGINGVVVGIVTANKDPENMGRVRVTFPWMEDAGPSYWARTATMMAGPDRGTYFLPEIEDEVLVAFEAGDVNHPYVLGALWNGQEAPPADNADGANNIRTIRSRNGHQVTFDDGDQGGSVEVATSGGRRIALDDSSGSERIVIEDGQNSIEVDSTGGSVSITGAGMVNVQAPAIELKGDGNVTIEASGILTLKGSMVTIN
ncbi:phage baseplate assembly protein V [Halalkalicoccus salilacus]|uniref:phage baseplate assembly protein V n=1 Tax=Halalkalicoccus salilacus TaxID=3117459 RepID=UPI00300ECA0F